MPAKLKSKLLIFLIILLLVLMIGFNSYAKADFEDDYRGYLATYDNYRIAQNNYLTTRSQFLTYGTTTSKNEALTAVKIFLDSRDDVIASYFSLLQMQNQDATFAAQLQENQDFIINHKQKIPGISSLEQAVSVSSEVENRELGFELISKKVVGRLLIKQVESLDLRFLLLTNQAAQMINNLRNQGKDVAAPERWFEEAKNREILSQEKLSLARSQLDRLSGKKIIDLSQNYKQFQFTVVEAKEFLEEGINFLKELSQSAKYGNY